MSASRIKHVLSHYKYAIQAAMETDMGEVSEGSEDWQTLFGLHLQSILTEFQGMDESEVKKELEFFLSRPTNKIQGLIL